MWRNLTLSAKHPAIPDLLSEAGVSRERLDYPLVTFLRADHLLRKDELAIVMNEFTENHVFGVGPTIEHFDWWKEMTDRLRDAEAAITYDKGIKAEHSVLMLNTGPHWNHNELGQRLSDDEMTEAYGRMVSTHKIRF